MKKEILLLFKAVDENSGKLLDAILSGHDGRHGIVHHLCVRPDAHHCGTGSKLATAGGMY